MQISLIYTEIDPWALGMRSVSAVLKEAGHHTRLILMRTDEKCLSDQTLEEVKELVKDSKIVGISSFSRGSDKAKQVIECLRPMDKLIIWGGLHATLNPEECLKSADLVCRGEGEEFMLELTERLEAGSDWKDLANAAYRDNRKVVINPLRPLISDLDKLPLIDYSFTDEFHLTDRGFVKSSGISDITAPIMFNGSRGCAFNCTYCSNTKLKKLFSGKGSYIRKMSVPKYIEHAGSLRQYFPKSEYYYFIDEDFFSRSPDELKEFSEEYRKQIGIPFECMASPLQISQEKMDLMVKAGLWRIRMGIESGSERTKKEVYNRHMSNEAVMRAASIISKYPQVVPEYFLIISNPYEKQEDLIETAQFLLNLPLHYYIKAFNLVFFPGSLLYEQAVKDGLVAGSQDSGYELDFLGGLQYKRHAWKRKNLYLNGLLFLMQGKSTRYRLGLLPRFLLPSLLHPKVVNFNDRNPVIIKFMISIKMFMLFLRKRAARLLVRLFRDPMSVYNLKAFIKRSLGSAAKET